MSLVRQAGLSLTDDASGTMPAMDRIAVGEAQWIEINEQALEANLALLKHLLDPATGLAAVVKSNAYGHGLDCVVPIAARTADWLAVHTPEEARRIRRMGVSLPLLVMGYVAEGQLADLDTDVHVLVSTAEVLQRLGRYREQTGRALPVHLKVETGTHRQGVSVAMLPQLCRQAASMGLEVVGIATHFANIEDTLDHSFAQEQLVAFTEAISIMQQQLGHEPPFIHAACSAAGLLFREADFTLARVGIAMYGHWPSRETQLSWIVENQRNGVQLQPVLTWRALIGQIQHVAKGETVGYGRTWRALRPTRLAVVPVGYADGYPRCLGNQAWAVVHGERVRVVGRVCMNILMLDVTDIEDVQVDDVVTLLGADGDGVVAAEELAGLAGTINYELLARLSPDIPRTVITS